MASVCCTFVRAAATRALSLPRRLTSRRYRSPRRCRSQAKGLDAVFRSVASSPYGSWLLGMLASGLVCYGQYCLLEARYRDLTPGR
jgi:hypothetical protein